MEQINQALAKIDLEQSQSQSIMTQTLSDEVSIYGKGKLSEKAIVKETTKILQAFPKMPTSMYNLLKDRFKENGFTDERLKDSVNHVIDTYEGWDKLPNIANFIQFDKKVKVYEYRELTKLVHERLADMHDYVAINTGLSKPTFVLKEYQEKYNLQLWSPK